MPNYRYVSQGEFYVTNDSDTILVTSGMTDCIGIAFIDKVNPAKRAVAHIDGMILYNEETALSNMKLLKQVFENKTESSDYDVFLLGGQKRLRNYRLLLPTLTALGVTPAKITDINEFCAEQNLGQSRYYKFSPINANATLICSPTKTPEFVSYKSSYFNPPISEDALSKGKGLTSIEEQEEYTLFAQLNEKVLSSDPSLSQVFRCSDDKDWLSEHKSLLNNDIRL